MSVETNFDMIAEGELFPTIDMCRRNAKYRLNESRFNGTYAENKYLIVMDNAGNLKTINRAKCTTTTRPSFNRSITICFHILNSCSYTI